MNAPASDDGSDELRATPEFDSELRQLDRFSEEPTWSGYGYYFATPPSELEIEIARPQAAILGDLDAAEGDVMEHLEKLVDADDPRIDALFEDPAA